MWLRTIYPYSFAADVNLSEEFTVGNIKITNVSIDQGINIVLNPATSTGTLTISLIGDVTYQVLSEERSGGSYLDTFNIQNLSTGDFQNIRITWEVDGTSIVMNYPFKIRVLGNYRHSQYNIPDEQQCSSSSNTDV